jgi:LDH2 family malate/lactate/ureidoglycolate dehydrogenase
VKEVETGRFAAETLRDFSVRILTALGVEAGDARTVADCLLYAELHGHASHGIVRLPVYAKRVAAGVVNARAVPRVGGESGPTCVVDGDNGLGPVVGRFGMAQALRCAHQFGIGMASARASNHFGPAGFYTEMALPQLCIGVAASNAPPNMAPWGGRERFLGTNPLSVAVPAGEMNPVVFDMASSVVARGNIILAAQRGESIPEGWAIDPQGNPTTDARQALLGSVLPFGGPKGSAISLLIDILAGVLSGASFGRHLNTLEDLGHVQNLGHVFIAIDVGRFMPVEEFLARVDDLIRQLKATPTAPGVASVLAPGEIELQRCSELGESGIPVAEDVRDQLAELASGLGVAAPDPQGRERTTDGGD